MLTERNGLLSAGCIYSVFDGQTRSLHLLLKTPIVFGFLLILTFLELRTLGTKSVERLHSFTIGVRVFIGRLGWRRQILIKIFFVWRDVIHYIRLIWLNRASEHICDVTASKMYEQVTFDELLSHRFFFHLIQMKASNIHGCATFVFCSLRWSEKRGKIIFTCIIIQRIVF